MLDKTVLQRIRIAMKQIEDGIWRQYESEEPNVELVLRHDGSGHVTIDPSGRPAKTIWFQSPEECLGRLSMFAELEGWLIWEARDE